MQETVHSKRFRLVEKDSYGIDLEYNQDFVALHIPWMTKFTKETLRDIEMGAPSLAEFLIDMGYTKVHLGISPDNRFANKLAGKFGFKYLGQSQGWEIYEKEIV